MLIFLAYVALTVWIYAGLIFTGRSLALVDAFFHNFPVMTVVADEWASGRLPLWNQYLFTGTPLMGSMQACAIYPPHVILPLIMPYEYAYDAYVLLHIAMAGAFTYAYARLIGLGKGASFAGGLTFMGTGFMAITLPHTAVITTGTWLPALIYAIERVHRRGGLRETALLGLVTLMMTLAGHPQMLFYAMLTAGMYVGLNALIGPAKDRLGAMLLVALGIGLGFLMAAPQLALTYELSTVGERVELSYTFFSTGGFSGKQIYALLAPVMHGMRSSGLAGTIPLAMAVLGFTLSVDREKQARIWAVIGVAAFLLTLGSALGPLHKLLYHVPVYNRFRGAGRHSMELSLALSVLAAYGYSAMVDRMKGRMRWAGALVIVLICLELPVYVWNKRTDYNTQEEMHNYGRRVFEFLAGAPGDGRAAFVTLELPDSLHAMRYGVNAIDGFDPLYVKDYGRLLDMTMYGYSTEWPELIGNNIILSMLGARYLVVDPSVGALSDIKGAVYEDASGRNAYRAPFSVGLPPGGSFEPVYRKLYGEDGIEIYENLNALPRAHAVSRAVPVESVEALRQRLYSFMMDPRDEAALSPADLKGLGRSEFSQGMVSLTEALPSRVRIEAEFPDGEGLLVLADQHYPGWNAYVDGGLVRTYKANAVQRAVIVPKGRHAVEFRYEPWYLYPSLFMSLALVAAALWAALRGPGSPPR